MPARAAPGRRGRPRARRSDRPPSPLARPPRIRWARTRWGRAPSPAHPSRPEPRRPALAERSHGHGRAGAHDLSPRPAAAAPPHASAPRTRRPTPGSPPGRRQVVAVLPRRLLAQQRDHLRGPVRADLRRRVQQSPRQSRVQAEPGHAHPSLRGPPRGIHRTDRGENGPRRRHRPARRRVQQGEPGRLRIAPARRLQRERRQVGHLDLGGGEARQTGVLRLRPAAVHRPRRLAPGPARPLPPRRLRGPYRRQGAQPARVIHTWLPRQSAVHDDPHTRHRQRGLGHGRREDHPAPRTGRQHRVLYRRRRPPVHLEHLDPVQVPQLPRHARDLPDPGKEAEDIPLAFRERPPHHRCHMRQQYGVHPHPVRRPDGPHRRRPHDLHRVRHTRRLDHRRPAEQPGPPRGVGRRRGRHQPQLGPQRLPHVQEEGRRRVRVQMTLVALVEHHHVDARQLLIPLKSLQQHTGRDDLHARVAPHHALPAHGVADAVAGLLAEQPRHPARRGPGGDAPRLRDDDTAYRPLRGPSPSRPARASGTSVVLPVPGGATRTAAPPASRASFRPGSALRTGRSRAS